MNRDNSKYQTYIKILEEELVKAMGCSEPISLAYGASVARDVLGCFPDHIKVEASGSIIKNVKSVVVPNTGSLKGIDVAVMAGIVAGQSDKKLECIEKVSDKQRTMIYDCLKKIEVEVDYLESDDVFDFIITLYHDQDFVKVRISHYHTSIVSIEKNHQVIYKNNADNKEEARANRSLLDMKGIWDFINSVEIDDIAELLDKQIECNEAICQEGLKNNYGANIGKIILRGKENSVETRAKAYAAAGSDARMSGCEMPVVINSGSGNQGITCSVPVIEYAKELNSSHEQLLRALALSNLVAIYEKTGIGTLSAYCGGVSAGAGAGAGIAYLCDGSYQAVVQTITNTLAIVSGIICDGAKPSCAAKIGESVDAALLGYHMYQQGQSFKSGDGIVRKDIDSTIEGVGQIARVGMEETNKEIIKLMINNKA